MSVNADTRLYASAIAIVSGVYSIGAVAGHGMGSMAMSASIMLIVGAAVLVHGIVLLTPAAERLGRASGPLMVLWAGIMLANQLLATTIWAGSMPSGGSMTWDGGMLAIAVLMLSSGLIMTRARST